MKAPTVYDVAAHAGVSIATVSRVLSRPGDVRESTRQRVLTSVRELGYVPSGAARGLAARRTGVLGLYFPGFDAIDTIDEALFDGDGGVTVRPDLGGGSDARPLNLYFDEVLRGAELEAWRRGFVLLVGVGRGDQADGTVRDMAGRVDGLLVLARSVPDETLTQLSRRVPIVIIAGSPRGDDFDHVSVSNTEGMHALTTHVLDALGPGGPPLYVAGPEGSPDDEERRSGFAAALSERGIDPATATLVRGEFTRASGRLVGEATLAGPVRPRAIICANDQMALGVMDAMANAGIEIPAEILVTGFDGIEAAALSTPRLTTIRQPMHDLGRAAIQVMARRLDDPTLPPRSIRLPVEVLLRESTEPTGPARSY
ncbi:MAG: LacI family DNA-binding transcriptional regulator [Mycetocola sp.]